MSFLPKIPLVLVVGGTVVTQTLQPNVDINEIMPSLSFTPQVEIIYLCFSAEKI